MSYVNNFDNLTDEQLSKTALVLGIDDGLERDQLVRLLENKDIDVVRQEDLDKFTAALNADEPSGNREILLIDSCGLAIAKPIEELLNKEGYKVVKTSAIPVVKELLTIEEDNISEVWGTDLNKLARAQGKGSDKRAQITLVRKNKYRNRPCICGSGKKFKSCCWSKAI